MKKTDPDTLFTAFATLNDKEEVKRFMTDLCTPGEINAFVERWEIAQLLHENKLSYRDIAAQTSASTTTVARVARFLRQEQHEGYKLALDRINIK